MGYYRVWVLGEVIIECLAGVQDAEKSISHDLYSRPS